MTAGKRMLRLAALVAVAGLVLTALAADPASEEELYRKGMGHFKQKSFRPAAEAFQQLLERFPDSERAREVQFHLAEAYRIARRFGRESTYPKAEKAYKKLTDSDKADRWRARALAGQARLYYAWSRYRYRQQIDQLYERAIDDYGKHVSKDSPRGLRREYAEVLCDRLQAGMRTWGYNPNWPAVQTAQRKAIAANQPVHDHQKQRLEWWKTVDELIATVDALEPGSDLEARARYVVGQRGAEKYLEQIVEDYADTEYWDDATYHLARQREQHRKYLEALALYKRLADRFSDRQSKYARQARHQMAEIRKPRLSVRSPYACIPGTRPRVEFHWRNQKAATFRVFRCQPFGHPHHTSLQKTAAAARGDQVLTWTEDLENKGEHQPYNEAKELDLADAGAYLVTADGGGVHAETLVLITRLAAVAKSASEQTKVFVTDALTGEPLPEADVQIAWFYRRNRKDIWHDAQGRTNDAGLYTHDHPADRHYRRYYLLARKGDSYAWVSSHRSHWSPLRPGLWFYGYTDRPAYRPEEEVHFKFVVRNYDGRRFQNTAGQRYRVRINEPRGGKLYEKVLTTSEYGTLSDSLTLAAEPKLGQYRIYIRRPDNKGRSGHAYFRVEEYKLPEYEVDIETARPTYRVGDTVRVKIAANYYFGGPVQDADVEVLVRRRQYWHFYHRPHEYPWYYEDIYRRRWGWRYYRRRGGSIVQREQLKTDEHGVATLSIDTPDLPDDPAQRHDYNYTIEARVVDKSRREIKSTRNIKVTVKPFYVYVRPKSHVYLPGDRIELDVVARNANDQPVKTQGMIRVYRAVYDEEKEEELRKAGKPIDRDELYDLTELAADKLATNPDGKATYAYTPDATGYLKIEMTALTDKEETVTGHAYVWVASEKEKYLGYRLSGVQVIPNKQTYKKGETAQVLLVSHFPNAHVWLGVEGNRIYDDQLVVVRERSKLIALPVKDEYSPNVYLTAHMVKDAMVWQHQAEIVVPPEDRFLNVEIAAPKKTFLPGESAELTLKATDHQGKPVVCELSLGLVDTSIYYIQPEYAQDIRKHFYGRKRRLQVRTQSSFAHTRLLTADKREELYEGRDAERVEQQLGQVRKQVQMDAAQPAANGVRARRALAAAPGAPMEKAAAAKGEAADRASGRGAGGAGTGGQPLVEPELREDFRSTAFWQPAVTTDPSGTATVSVKFPDSLTDWTATARAVTPDTAVGTVTWNTKTKKNIIVRLQAPRFFQERDRVTISAIAHNYLEEPKDVEVTLRQSGLHLTQAPVVTIQVPSGGEKRVDWVAQVRQPGEVKLTVMAKTDVESDAMTKTYEALPHGVEKFVCRSGSVGDPVVAAKGADLGDSPEMKTEVVQTLRLPAERNQLATVLNIDLSPSIASTMVDSLDYLAKFPYGCVEQTLSRFVPCVIAADTLQDLNLENPKLQAKLPKMISKGLARIYAAQRSDGGWGWWPGARRTDPWMTAYAVYGLSLAREAGVEIEDSRLQRGIGALRQRLVHLEDRDDTMAWCLYVLSRHKIKEDKWLERTWNRREKLNAYTRALMALAFHQLGDRERATIMLRNLEDYLEQDKENATAHWGKMHNYWHWSHDAVEATSYALKAYVAIEPNNPLVKQIMKWLVFNRKGNRWKSTRDTAKAVYALCDYLKSSQELSPNYKVTVLVNGQAVRELTVTRDNALSLDGRVTLGDADLKSGDNEIRIVKEGPGNLYYASGLYYYTKEEKIAGAGHEIFVKRTYHKLALDDENKQTRSPIAYGDALASGDRIEVTLEIEAKNDYEYLVFEDPKPSGCEPVELRSGYRWRQGLGSYMEIRDEKTAFFVSRISQGTHTLRYT
ncbi:MAG: MG2 domain-containing protein, partial [Planctomycetota bacterium]